MILTIKIVFMMIVYGIFWVLLDLIFYTGKVKPTWARHYMAVTTMALATVVLILLKVLR